MWRNSEQLVRPDGHVAHVNCILDKHGYNHTPRICTTHCLSSAIMVAQMPLNVMFICRLPILLLTPSQTIVF
jgi:hypothetical protein